MDRHTISGYQVYTYSCCVASCKDKPCKPEFLIDVWPMNIDLDDKGLVIEAKEYSLDYSTAHLEVY